MPKPRLLFMAGSSREGSINRKLARQAYEFGRALEADCELIELADYDMPLYNGDLEARDGLPENAKRLKAKFIACDGFLLAAPEYNSSLTPLLKNTLDWISRKETDDEPALAAYQGKVAALTAASPGGFGGLRGLVPLRMMLGNIGVHVLPDQLAISRAHEAFGDDGALSDDGQAQRLRGIVASLVTAAAKLKSA